MGICSYRVGVMFSTTGRYSGTSQSMLNGVMLALKECAETVEDVRIEPVIVDPQAQPGRYAQLAEALIDSGIRQIVGCYTSPSRKEVIPVFEKRDALLWYPSHYEGFESSSNVIYTGASPNQHVLPLALHMLERGYRRAFCVGSNYIWAWENTRVFREAMTAYGGEVLAERYLPVGDIEFSQLIEEILAARPDFVFGNFIGASECEFFRQFRLACMAKGIDQPVEMPVASCTLSESDLAKAGAEFSDGHLSASVYFSSLASPANDKFVASYGNAFQDGPPASAVAAASYVAVKLLVASLGVAKTDSAAAIKRALLHQRLDAPQGEVWIDPETCHAWHTPRIGRSTSNARFEIIFQESGPTRPDPYLIQSSPRFSDLSSSNRLKVVR